MHVGLSYNLILVTPAQGDYQAKGDLEEVAIGFFHLSQLIR